MRRRQNLLSVRAAHVAVSVAIVLVAGSWLTGCAQNPSPILVKPAPDGPAILVVDAVAAEDPEAKRWARFLRTALLDRLIRAEVFTVVYDRDRPISDGPVLTLEGRLIEADRGSDAWRFIVGSGLGRPRLAGTFEVSDVTGSVRAAFDIASEETGPDGLSGHWSPLSMETLARDLGGDAADAIIRWRRGEEIAAATWP